DERPRIDVVDLADVTISRAVRDEPDRPPIDRLAALADLLTHVRRDHDHLPAFVVRPRATLTRAWKTIPAPYQGCPSALNGGAAARGKDPSGRLAGGRPAWAECRRGRRTSSRSRVGLRGTWRAPAEPPTGARRAARDGPLR